MNSQSISGIIVRTCPAGEAHLILKVITSKGGKISLFAAHARKSKRRFSGSFDLFDRGEFEIKQGKGELANVISFRPAPSFKNLRDSLDKLAMASLVCECFDLLVPEQGHEGNEIALLLNSSLSEINDCDGAEPASRLAVNTLRRLLHISGISSEHGNELKNHPELKDLIQVIEEHCERRLSSASIAVSTCRL